MRHIKHQQMPRWNGGPHLGFAPGQGGSAWPIRATNRTAWPASGVPNGSPGSQAARIGAATSGRSTAVPFSVARAGIETHPPLPVGLLQTYSTNRSP